MNRTALAMRLLGRPAIVTMLAGCLSTGCYTGISAKQIDLANGASTIEVDEKGKRTGKFTDDKDVEGLRYFLPAPVLVVEQIDKDKYDARVEYVVDHSRIFAVQPTEVMASSTATIEFNPDGTLKSFQLNQDSTEVAAAAVKGLQELETKNLDLQKEAIDNAAGSAARAKGRKLPRVEEGQRRVCLYRIDGPQLSPIYPSVSPTSDCSVLQVEKPSPAAEDPAEAGDLSLDISDDSTDVVMAIGGRPLRVGADVTKIAFFKADGFALKPEAAAALRKEIKDKDGTLLIPVARLREGGVTQIRFEGKTKDVPNV